MSKNTCSTCRFWWSWDFIGKNGYGKGECRRYPPTVALLPKSVVELETVFVMAMSAACPVTVAKAELFAPTGSVWSSARR